MIREYAQNIIDHLKDLINEKNNLVDRYNTNLIEYQQNTGKEKYGDSRKDGCQTKLDESRHNFEKLMKSDEKVEFEDELRIELKMELVRKVDNVVALINDKDNLKHQRGKKVQDLE